MRFLRIKVSQIDASKGLRAVSEAWAQTMAEEAQRDGGPRWSPVDVVDLGSDKYRLVDGRRRLAAVLKVGLDEIDARVLTAAEYAEEASLQLHEIKANLFQSGVTALERAIYLSAWKTLHEAATGPAKRGRKSAAELAQTSAAIQAGEFVGLFSAVAAETLGISERSIQAAVQVARSLGENVRTRIASTPIANVMSELLQLSGETVDRQEKIVGLMLSEPPAANSVAEAIAIIDRVPPPKQLELWETVYVRLSKMTEAQQDRLFDQMAPAIERWFANRSTGRKAA